MAIHGTCGWAENTVAALGVDLRITYVPRTQKWVASFTDHCAERSFVTNGLTALLNKLEKYVEERAKYERELGK